MVMEKDMSFGGFGNNNRNPMSQEAGFDISDLYQNEESIDLASYMTSANLELCEDNLFQSLFPTGSDHESNVKIEKTDPFESELSDWWTDPVSAYSSACSSAAPSPVQFLNTPPVTPKSEGGYALSPETIRQQQDHIAQFSMSRTQLNPMFITAEDQAIAGPNSNGEEISTVTVKQDPDSPHINRVYFFESEHERNKNGVTKSLLPELVKARPTDPSNYEEGIYGKAMKRSLRVPDDGTPETTRQQAQQDNIAQFSMSRTQLNPMFITAEDQAKVTKSLLPELVKARPTDPSNYEEGIYGKAMKRSSMVPDDGTLVIKSSKFVSKDSNEYKIKRERNNIAVRKSRDKAKVKSVETEQRVTELSTENKRLHDRVGELTHELNTLKGILKSLPQTAHMHPN